MMRKIKETSFLLLHKVEEVLITCKFLKYKYTRLKGFQIRRENKGNYPATHFVTSKYCIKVSSSATK